MRDFAIDYDSQDGGLELAKELEEPARIEIDRLLENAKLLMQSIKGAPVHAAREGTLSEFARNADFGFADYQ